MKLLLTGGQIGGIIAGAVIGLLLIVIVCWAIATRNKFVLLENQYEEAFHNIDIYLKKRYDLIPNLVETVKGYAKHESQTLQSVIEARNKLAGATTADEIIAADNSKGQAIRGLNMLVER